MEEVADLLKLSTCVLYRMAQRKQIPSVVIAGSRRFDPGTIAMWPEKKNPSMKAAARQMMKLAA